MEKTQDEKKKLNNEYHRNYRKQNPEKIKQIIFKCWQKKIEKAMSESVG